MMSRKQKQTGLMPPGLEMRLSGGPGALTFAEAARAVDLYAPLAAARGAITLKEGEPPPDFKLLKKIAAYARKKWPGLGIDVETGGELLEPEKADFFSAQGADLWLNLDGGRGAAGPVARRLGKLSARQLRKICAAVAFSPRTIGRLPRTMRSLRRYDLKEVLADLEPCQGWSGKSLLQLRRVLRGLKESFRLELRSGATRWPQPSRLYGLVPGAGRAGTPKNGPVSGIFEEEMGPLADIEEVLGELAGEKNFGDFGRRPRRPARKEIKNLMLEPGPGPGLAGAREVIDQFICSPGRRKALAVPAGRPGLFRKIAVYSALRSESLGKKIRISLETGRMAGRR